MILSHGPILKVLLLFFHLFHLTYSSKTKPASRDFIRTFKYPVTPSLMNFRAVYTNYVSRYPYWGHYENYFDRNNVHFDTKTIVSQKLKPKTVLNITKYLTHYKIAPTVRPLQIRVNLVDSNVSKFFICTKQGKNPVEIQDQKEGYFLFEAHDCDFGGQTKDSYGLEKWFMVDKVFEQTGWLSIFSFDYELDNAEVPSIKARIELSCKLLFDSITIY